MITPVIDDIVDFQLVQSGIVGDQRTDVKVSGTLDYNTARMIDPSIQSKHTALYPYFKDKVQNVNDPSVYKYMTCINNNGVTEVIGIPWILDSSYTVVDGRVATIVIANWREDWRSVTETFLSNLGANYSITVENK